MLFYKNNIKGQVREISFQKIFVLLIVRKTKNLQCRKSLSFSQEENFSNAIS